MADEVPTPYSYPDLDTAELAGPSRKAIGHAGLMATDDAIRDAFADSRQSDGTYRQDNAFRYLIATA